MGSVVDPQGFFDNPDLTFHLVSDPDPHSILLEFFLIFLTKILSLFSGLVSVLGCSLWRCKLFRGIIFLQKGIYIFLSIFVEKLSNCISFFWVVLLQFHFGPRAARFRIRKDFFWILLKVSGPTGFGSTTLYRTWGSNKWGRRSQFL